MAQLNVDMTGMKPAEDRSPLPPGTYLVIIESSDVKATKDERGEYCAFVAQVVEGPNTGRKIFGNINTKNPNPQAEEIGKRLLLSLAKACGKAREVDPGKWEITVQNTAELHGIPHYWRTAETVDKKVSPPLRQVQLQNCYSVEEFEAKQKDKPAPAANGATAAAPANGDAAPGGRKATWRNSKS